MPQKDLTPRTVEQLEPEAGQARTAYFDSHPKAPAGFCLRVSARRKVYYALATNRETKQRVWIAIGDASTISLDDARAAARVKMGQLARGNNPNDLARAARTARRVARETERRDRDALSVAALVRLYINSRAGRISAVTEKEYRRELAVDLQPTPFGAKPVTTVIRADVREFLAGWQKRAPHLHDHLLALLRSSFRWALIEEAEPGRPLVERDPTVGLEEIAARRRRTRHLSDEEIPHVWRSVEQLGKIKGSFVRLLILLGLRRGEAHVAEWANVAVDFEAERGMWRVPTAVRKVRVTRKDDTPDLEIPLPALAVRVLAELHGVTGDRRRLFRFSVRLLGEEVKVASGLRDVSIHDLRRTMSAGLERLGAPPHVISMALGHTRVPGSVASDVHYTLSRRPAEYRMWLERWAEHVEALIAGRRGAKVVAHPSAAGPAAAVS